MVRPPPPRGAVRAIGRGAGHPAIAALNALCCDAATLGNHDFAFGKRLLAAALAGAVYPVVLTNARLPGLAAVPFALLDRVAVARDGSRHPLRLGVIGLIPPQTAAWEAMAVPDLQTEDGLAAAIRTLPLLHKAGADLVVALVHGGLGEGAHRPGAENAAGAVARLPGIDAVIAGHVHEVWPAQPTDHPRPGPAPVVMAGYAGSHLGVIDLVLRQQAGAWRVVAARSQVRPGDALAGPGDAAPRQGPRSGATAEPDKGVTTRAEGEGPQAMAPSAPQAMAPSAPQALVPSAPRALVPSAPRAMAPSARAQGPATAAPVGPAPPQPPRPGGGLAQGPATAAPVGSAHPPPPHRGWGLAEGPATAAPVGPAPPQPPRPGGGLQDGPAEGGMPVAPGLQGAGGEGTHARPPTQAAWSGWGRSTGRHRADGQDPRLPASAAAIVAIAAPLLAAAARASRVRIGRSRVRLCSHYVMLGQHAGLGLMAMAQRQAVRRVLAGSPHAGLPVVVAVAPFRAGGRGGPGNYVDVPPGALRRGDIADLYAFSNRSVVMAATGADMADWLERAAGAYLQVRPGQADQPLLDPAFPSYRFDLLDGLCWRVDLAQPPRYAPDGALRNPNAQRIVGLWHRGRPVAPDQRFLIATTDYRASTPLYAPVTGPLALLHADRQPLRQVVGDYLRRARVVTPPTRAMIGFTPVPGASARFATAPTARLDEAPMPLTALGLDGEGFLQTRLDLRGDMSSVDFGAVLT